MRAVVAVFAYLIASQQTAVVSIEDAVVSRGFKAVMPPVAKFDVAALVVPGQ